MIIFKLCITQYFKIFKIKCKENYEKMYKMLSDKIINTQKMEGNIIDSFKSTIMKVYTKSEKNQEESKM
jgi:hypothetical protein